MFLRCRDRASASREGSHTFSFADDSPEFVAALVGVGIAAAASVVVIVVVVVILHYFMLQLKFV